MKRIIINYEVYEKNIFNGAPLKIEHAYFAGFKFIENEEVFFMNYQLLTNDGRALNFASNFTSEDMDEKMLLEAKYNHLIGTGISRSNYCPTLMSVSSFYSNKEEGLEYYSIYCRLLLVDNKKDNTVYKLIFNKSSFLSIMIGDNLLYSYDIIDYSITDYTNTLLPNIKTEKINQTYGYIIRNMYVEVPKKLSLMLPLIGKNKMNKLNLICLISVTFKDIRDNHFRLFYKIYLSYKDFKTLNPSKYTTSMQEFLNFDNSLEKDRVYVNSTIGDIAIQISKKSNYPINKVLLYAIPYNNTDIEPVYVEFTEDAFDNFKEAMYNYIFK